MKPGAKSVDAYTPQRRNTPIAKSRPRKQYAALPLAEHGGRTSVMLITSRETRRWVIPKGNPERGLEPHALAAKEAFEEAGLVGRVGSAPVGSFSYAKRLAAGGTVPVEVKVFPLLVEGQLDDWPEKGQRETRWLAPGEAALLVQEGGLAELLLSLVD